MPHPTLPRQLPLPLAAPLPAGAPLLLPEVLVPAHTAWTSLSPPEQARFRRTLTTLLQEVARVHDAG